ncbi:transglycosylase SLT domain-containing protein [Brucepastera parasyntrophica]|uniref:transglycosylase SLT domain-containing protein n=1 Tax=Brucepastera parasyntrophica TaxID=2880008 RepID=UPI00210AAE86|nr:transglycosylase SLT domain-containing protein [Brucepastera parasyntrophica]ULQ60880.1 transglycosylase SLT domain-containing protein [Brucepastera parasyntrophica]
MEQKSTIYTVYPKKVLLAVFIFGVIILAGKSIYSQFNIIAVAFSAETEAEPQLASAVEPELFRQKTMTARKQIDRGLALYRAEVSREDVVNFYNQITGDESITRIILDNASKNNIAPPLAFALAWEESRFQIMAVNKNASSVDRGLFQLNNKAFPKLTETDFFTPETNAYYGLSHLRYCLDHSGNEVTALAMYNAGPGKVSNDKTPKRTLDYVSRILNNRDNLTRMFNQDVVVKYVIADETETVSALARR